MIDAGGIMMEKIDMSEILPHKNCLVEAPNGKGYECDICTVLIGGGMLLGNVILGQEELELENRRLMLTRIDGLLVMHDFAPVPDITFGQFLQLKANITAAIMKANMAPPQEVPAVVSPPGEVPYDTTKVPVHDGILYG